MTRCDGGVDEEGKRRWADALLKSGGGDRHVQTRHRVTAKLHTHPSTASLAKYDNCDIQIVETS